MSYRFHRKNKNKLLFISHFRNNEMGDSKPVFLLDNIELTYEVEERRLTPTMFREIEGRKITREFYLWVNLPDDWMDCKQLEVENILTIPREKLLEEKSRMQRWLDETIVTKEGCQIKGWYFKEKNMKIRFMDLNGNELPAAFTYEKRPDVSRAYPEADEDEVTGFLAYIKGKPHRKIKAVFSSEGKEETELIELSESYIKKIITNGNIWIDKAIAYYRQFGIKATFSRVGEKILQKKYSDYEHWLKRHLPTEVVLQKQRKENFSYMPKISIVVPLYKTPEKYLREMIESVEQQSYTNWELCLSDGSGENSPHTELLKTYEQKDTRIRVIHNKKELRISENTNEALKICTGDFIAFLDHDDLLTANALYECVHTVNRYPETEMIYTDEDKVNADSTTYYEAHFKPDFNIDLLRCVNYFCHLVVIKRELYQRVGLLNPVFDGSQDHEYAFRCVENTTHIQHIPKILYHWRTHAKSSAADPESKLYGVEAGRRAIQEHYERVGISAEAFSKGVPGFFYSKYQLKETPLVSIIIPNKDHVEDLKKCIESIEEKSTYKNIEYVLVENNSTEQETFDYYKELEEKNSKVRVLYWKEKGFNYPAINTYGVKHAKGEYLLFLNNDTEMINSDCIEEMLGYCMRKDVGAVGAKLYYPDGSIQHAGVIVGLGGVAGHAFLEFPHDSWGYYGRAVVAQNLSAVTAACMMVKKHVYEEVGGFDEGYAVAYNDIDFCLKVREAGYLIVYNPNAELKHYESKSRGYEDTDEKRVRYFSEIHRFQTRWYDFLENGDPYYNPNLTLDRNDFGMKI